MRAVCSIDASGPRAISRDATSDASGVAAQLQQVVRQHQLAGIDHHAIRIRLDETVERLCRSLQIALVMLREREIEERVVAERGKIVGGKFQVDRSRASCRDSYTRDSRRGTPSARRWAARAARLQERPRRGWRMACTD